MDTEGIITTSGPIPEPNVVFSSESSWAYYYPEDIVTDPNHDNRHLTEVEALTECLNPVDLALGQAAVDAWYAAKREGKSAGLWSGVGEATLASRRNMLYEVDGETLAWQKARAKELIRAGILNRVVYSGHKSLHCRITLDTEPADKAEYQAIWSFLNTRLFDGKADKQCALPSHKTRHPGGIRPADGTKVFAPTAQKLLHHSNTMIRRAPLLPLIRPNLAAAKAASMSRDLSAAFAAARRARYPSRQGDGAAENSPSVRAFLDTDFSSKTSGWEGRAHSSIHKAMIAAISKQDDATLAQIIDKARRERWEQREIDDEIRGAEKYLTPEPA